MQDNRMMLCIGRVVVAVTFCYPPTWLALATICGKSGLWILQSRAGGKYGLFHGSLVICQFLSLICSQGVALLQVSFTRNSATTLKQHNGVQKNNGPEFTFPSGSRIGIESAVQIKDRNAGYYIEQFSIQHSRRYGTSCIIKTKDSFSIIPASWKLLP